MDAPVIYRDFEHYFAIHNKSPLPDDSWMRATKGMSDVQLKRARSTYERAIVLYQESRDKLRIAFVSQLSSGVIQQMTDEERLQDTAMGCGIAADAAQRVLERRRNRRDNQ